MTNSKQAIIGIDTGGTFTDFVYFHNGKFHVLKVLSTPDDPGRAIINGLMRIGRDNTLDFSIIHGSTVATNTLLERKGARCALITTKGFKDLLEIGRQNRPGLYDLNTDRPQPLIPAALRYELDERTLYDGTIQREVTTAACEKLLDTLQSKHIDSIAVCFLHSYANGKNETAVARAARKRGFSVSPSSEILPEYREYERFSTTAVNAYVSPKMDAYLESLQKKLPRKNIHVMKSNGGIISAQTARKESVHTILSGPAGGVVGAYAVGKNAGYGNVITFDMGGTSTDVALCPGAILTTTESAVAGCPIKVPMIDIHTVGAGGGSIASMDIGGALRVGPESAGADPAPVCYGKGGDLTVTDANLYLGRLDRDYFLGGEMKIDQDRLENVMQKTAKQYGMDPVELAAGIIKVVNSNMEKALHVISIGRGYNPADFVLVSFGGAGSLHAADLASTLGIKTVIIPRNPGLYSSVGMLFSDLKKDYSQTVLLPASPNSMRSLERTFDRMAVKARKEMASESIPDEKISVRRSIDVRYVGQSFELTIPFTQRYIKLFHTVHEQRYGYCNESLPAEVVTLRVQCTGKIPHPKLIKNKTKYQKTIKDMSLRTRNVFSGKKLGKTRIYTRDDLEIGTRFKGPAVIHEYSTTTYVPPDFGLTVDTFENLILMSGKK
jgi:N-methylhydantoinase A